MNDIQPLKLASLPSVASSRARMSRTPWPWLGSTQTSTTVALAGVGSLRLSFEGFEEPESTSREELVLVGRDGRRGRVAVDRWFALGVVAATLGARPPRVLRALGRAERGVLAGHVAASLAQRGCPVLVSLDAPGFADVLSVASLSLRAEAEVNNLSGRIRVDVPPEWLARREESALRGALIATLAPLHIRASVELATTTLRVAEWAEAQPGDAVLFAGYRFLTASEWPVSLRVGDYAADAMTDLAGAVVFAGPFRAVVAREVPAAVQNVLARERIGKEPGTMSNPTSEDDLNLSAIGAAPIEVVAEVGRLTLRGEEVLGLQRGSVIPLGHQGQRVNLIVGGQPWARGELVNVEGELGVRITEIARV